MIVKIFNQGSGLDEWCLLDFQGEIVGDLLGNKLGNMKVNGETVELEVGSYLLEGQIVKLKQPYLIIGKENKSIETKEGNSGTKDYDMVGLVHMKIHFKTRPKPKPIYPK